jgi:hypothetical protein
MKPILLLLLLGVTITTAQQNNPPPPAAPVLPPPIAPPAAPADPEPVPTPPRAGPRRVRTAVEDVTGNVAEIVDMATSAAKSATALALGQAFEQSRFHKSLPRSTKTGRTLVVRSTHPDPESLENAEEDLSVMALILRKATGGARGDDKRLALGIEVDSSVFGSSSGARNVYLEGYGALFLLGVRFPLLAPPEKSDDPKPKETASTEWTEAREELRNTARPGFEAEYDVVWRGGGGAATEAYSADKVETLKNTLLDALKNATHIRALKPDEFVTVVIQGAESPRVETSVESRAGDKRRTVKKTSMERDETVMTVRVKKSDVDAFAKGSLDQAGFRKQASIQTYFRRGDASVATSPFLAPQVR